MRKRRISAPAAANLALLITLGMGAPSHVMAQGTQAAALPPVTSLPTALEAVLRGYEDAWSARDAVALSNLFTSDGFVDGAVGYIIGGYSAGPDRPAVGKFVLALRRASSGTWLIAADIDNGN
jgi:ketosteroid isomerase-like protein